MILDQPWQLELFHLQQLRYELRYALRVEIHTGGGYSRGSLLRATNDVLLRNCVITQPLRTKRLALQALEGYITTKEQEAMGL